MHIYPYGFYLEPRETVVDKSCDVDLRPENVVGTKL